MLIDSEQFKEHKSVLYFKKYILSSGSLPALWQLFWVEMRNKEYKSMANTTKKHTICYGKGKSSSGDSVLMT